MRFLISVVFMLPFFLFSRAVYAQVGQGSVSGGLTRSTVNFTYAEPNELTVVVSLIGEIRAPGRYEISRNLSLLDLLALAGGWSDRTDLSDVTITRIVQTANRIERRDLRIDLGNLTKLNGDDLRLEHGDIIRVGSKSSLTFGEVASYLSTAAVVTTAIITVINQSKR
jgi:protein involved in polysaccharide export with SLBB domain